MATPNTMTSVMTMAEAAKGIGAKGNMIPVIDVLAVGTPLLEEGHWEMSTDFNSYHYDQTMTDVVGTDSVTNQGISWEVPTSRPVTEMIYGLESALKIDSRILRRHPNPEEFKRVLVERFLRGLSKSFHDRIFYGNSAVGLTTKVSPTQVTGLHSRFGIISGATYNQVQGTQYWPLNVVSASGTGANAQMSSWLLKWGLDGIHFGYPKDGQEWVEVDEMPELQLVYDSSNNPFRADVSFFNIKYALCVGDWRCVQRMCNIDGSSHKWTSSLMVQLLAGIPDTDWSGLVAYVPRTVWIEMSQEALSNANSFHFDNAPWGRKTVYFQEVPIQVIDRLVNTEPIIS
jgi:Major capsid protein GP7